MKTSAILLSVLFLVPTAFAKSWNSNNNPYYLLSDWTMDQVEFRLDQLPSKGAAASIPWASSYVPNQRNGFSYRPHAFQSLPLSSQVKLSKELTPFFNLNRPDSYSDLKTMSLKEINELSPIEKYSIYVGDYSYSLSRQFRPNYPDDAYWEGYCDAWSAAAIYNPEPKPKTVLLGDIPITFTSGDLKILLTGNAYISMYRKYRNGSITIGRACRAKIAQTEPGKETTDTEGLKDEDLEKYLRDPKFNLSNSQVERALDNAQTSQCDDTNAGTFHLTISNQMGLHHKSFVFDVTRDVEIWNQPASSYTSEITPMNGVMRGSAPGTVKNVHVKTALTYADDTFYGWSFSEPTFSPSMNPSVNFMDEYQRYQLLQVALGERDKPGVYPEDIQETINYEYVLDLNEENEIIGGNWITYDRPDYIWIPSSPALTSSMSHLTELL